LVVGVLLEPQAASGRASAQNRTGRIRIGFTYSFAQVRKMPLPAGQGRTPDRS
jgi:hypothetical protein